MTVTLVTGPAASGKTEAILARAAGRYAADPFAPTLVLVPTSRHADQFRKRLVQRCGVALNLEVLTLNQFARDRAAATTVDVPSRGLLAALIGRVIADQAESGAAGAFARIADAPGLLRLVSEAVSELQDALIEPRAFSEAATATGNPVLAALAGIYASFDAEMSAHGWTHPAALPARVADAIDGGSLPGLVLFDGFRAFSRAELALVVAVLQRAPEAWLTIESSPGEPPTPFEAALRTALPGAVEVATDFHPPAAVASATAAHDRESEMRAIARDIKVRLAANPGLRPSDFAVAFRQAAPVLRTARQIFAEYNLPLDPAAGEPLSARPFGGWVIRLLRLPGGDGTRWKLRDLVAVLRSGFLDRNRWALGNPRAVGTIARRGRQRGLWGGLESLRQLAVSLASPETSHDGTTRNPSPYDLDASAGLTRALDDLVALLETTAPATTAEHARRIDAALFGPGALVRAAARSDLGVAEDINALRGHLLGFVAVEEALGGQPVPFAAFVDQLAAAMDVPSATLRQPGGVLLAPMHTFHGLRFAHVAAAGLSEGEFPAPRRATPLLGALARRLLAEAGLVLPETSRATEDQLWQSVRSRADVTFTAWRQRVDSRGKPRAASYYFETTPGHVDLTPVNAATAASARELAIRCTRDWRERSALRPPLREPWSEEVWGIVRAAASVEHQRRTGQEPGAFGGVIPAGLAQASLPARFSPTGFESFRQCPFQFFGKQVLRLRELDEELEDADPLTRGTVVHDILEHLLAPLASNGQALNGSTLPGVLQRLQSEGEAAWRDAPQKYGFGRAALWGLEWRKALPQLVTLLQEEARFSDEHDITRIRGVELPFVFTVPANPPFEVNGKFDRIDEGDGIVVVVDYKTGQAIHKKAVTDGYKLQLPLYACAAREITGAGRAIAAYVYTKGHKRFAIDTADPASATTPERGLDVIIEARNTAARGEFPVRPADLRACGYCAFGAACRKSRSPEEEGDDGNGN
ncbi:MAG: PD-(D/E)XK nuclease family protein [Chloroflexi bacterium]|nr:PD-(D/E)XK nuclease family protein [Chloroflexota bacterium]